MNNMRPVHNLNSLHHSQSVRWYFTVCFMAVVLAGCVSTFDSKTHMQLTDLKKETVKLVESFDLKPIAENEDNIKRVSLNLKKAMEYELGKGKSNSDTAKQFKLITKMFDEDVNDYRQFGPASKDLGKKYFSQASATLGQAFDAAISTENLKNKN